MNVLHKVENVGRMANPIKNLQGVALQALITLACSSGFLLFGYDQGVFSGVLESTWFKANFPDVSSSLLGIVSSIYDIGGAVGAIVCMLTGNFLGRKRTILFGCIVSIVGSIIQGLAKSIATLLVGRKCSWIALKSNHAGIIAGIGVGQLTSTIGVWQAETSAAHNRGMLMSLELSLCALGLFLAQWINYGFGSNNGAAAFMFPILFQIVFLGWTICLVPMLPESPRWLISKGKVDQAAVSLVRLGKKGTTMESEDVLKTIREMQEIAALEDINGIEWFKSLFRPGPTQNGKRVLMSCAINAFQQLTGVNSVTYYVPTLLITFIGVSRSDSLWIAGLTSVISLVFSFVPVFLIDIVGRLPFLIFGAIGQAICFFIVAGLYANLPLEGTDAAKSYGIAIVSFIYIFFAIYSACWLGPSWMYGPEVLPLRGRTHGMGLSVIFYWLFNFMIVQVTPVALANISWKYYVILGVFNAMFVPLLWFFVETKGKTLEDLDIYFAERYKGGAELRQIENVMAVPDHEKSESRQLEDAKLV